MGEDCSSRSIKFGDWANFPSKDEIKLNTKSTVYSWILRKSAREDDYILFLFLVYFIKLRTFNIKQKRKSHLY